jgi:catechol 2,3-dioxygenase-like lactoylglutathione lyase family enzyme
MNADGMTEEALAVVLRVANTDSSLAWYQRLGFNMEYEHSSGPALNQTMAVIRRGKLALILSDRDEAGRSGALLYMKVSDIAPVAGEFDVTPQDLFGAQQVELHDPDGNRIRVIAAPNITPRPGRLIVPS